MMRTRVEIAVFVQGVEILRLPIENATVGALLQDTQWAGNLPETASSDLTNPAEDGSTLKSSPEYSRGYGAMTARLNSRPRTTSQASVPPSEHRQPSKHSRRQP